MVTFAEPPKQTNGVTLIRWTSNENAVFHCSLDNLPYTTCGEGSQWIGRSLADGIHTLQVRATDDAGNIATPRTVTWDIGKGDHSFYY